MLLHKKIPILFCAALLFSPFAFTKIALADDADDDEDAFAEIQQIEAYDPWESLNRKIFGFNEVVFDNVYIPFGRWYENNIPLAVRWSFKNFTQHYTETPQDMILSVLDFDLEGFLVSLWRFTINSTIGMYGILDPANDLGLKSVHKTFGQVFHFYGIPAGPYGREVHADGLRGQQVVKVRDLVIFQRIRINVQDVCLSQTNRRMKGICIS